MDLNLAHFLFGNAPISHMKMSSYCLFWKLNGHSYNVAKSKINTNCRPSQFIKFLLITVLRPLFDKLWHILGARISLEHVFFPSSTRVLRVQRVFLCNFSSSDDHFWSCDLNSHGEQIFASYNTSSCLFSRSSRFQTKRQFRINMLKIYKRKGT